MMHLLRKNSSTKQQVGSPSTTGLLTSKRRPLNWRPRTADEIVRKKNRKFVSQHLKKIGKAAHRELSLDEDGVCVFSFKKFVVVVEVPEDRSSIVLFYAKVSHLSPGDNKEEVQKFLNIFNQRQQGSSTELGENSSTSEGTCPSLDPTGSRMHLGMNEDEVNLCLSVPIRGLSFQDTADHLEQFVKTAVTANRKLGKIKSIPGSPSQPPSPGLTTEGSPQTRRRVWSMDSQESVSNMSQCSLFNLFACIPKGAGAEAPAQEES